MKRIAAIIVTLVIYPAISSAAQEAAAPQEAATSQEAAASKETAAAQEAAAAQKAAIAQKAVGRVYVMRGSVTAGQGSQVNISEPIVSGMLIKTGKNSAALLKFDDRQVVTMQSDTTFQVREYHYDANQVEDSKIDFAFFEGGVRLVTGIIGQKKRLAFSLSTPNATIRGDVAKIVVVKADNLIYSKVLDGDIRITNAAGTASFKTGDSPAVPSPVMLASEFYAARPRGIFNELLSIPVVAPLIIEPAPASSAVSATATSAGSAPILASVPAPGSAPASAPETGSASSPESASVPSAAPVAVSASAPAPAPVAVSASMPAPSAESAAVSVSVLVPAQAAPSCTCTCTLSGK